MSDTQTTLLFMTAAIVVTALALFRQRALGGKALAAALAATLFVASFLFMTL